MQRTAKGSVQFFVQITISLIIVLCSENDLFSAQRVPKDFSVQKEVLNVNKCQHQEAAQPNEP